MRQARQDRALALEPRRPGGIERRQVQQLHRHGPLVASIAPAGPPDRTHAAAAEGRLEGVGADRGAGRASCDVSTWAWRNGATARRSCAASRPATRPSMAGCVACRRASQAARPSTAGRGRRRAADSPASRSAVDADHRLVPEITFCGRDATPRRPSRPRSPRCRSSRALAQSRWTVRSDTPRIAAISANEKPQKNFRSTSSASPGSSAASSSRASPRPRGRERTRRRAVVERGEGEFAAALLRAAIADVVDHQPPHRPRGIAEEPIAIGEGGGVAPGHRQIRLVQQRRRAERDRSARAPTCDWASRCRSS